MIETYHHLSFNPASVKGSLLRVQDIVVSGSICYRSCAVLAARQLCALLSIGCLMSGQTAGGSGKQPQLEGRVELRNVSFHYPARPEVQVFR